VLQNKRKKYNILRSKQKYLALKASNNRVTMKNVHALQKNVKTSNKNVREAQKGRLNLNKSLKRLES
jgi:hypothetical protein